MRKVRMGARIGWCGWRSWVTMRRDRESLTQYPSHNITHPQHHPSNSLLRRVRNAHLILPLLESSSVHTFPSLLTPTTYHPRPTQSNFSTTVPSTQYSPSRLPLILLRKTYLSACIHSHVKRPGIFIFVFVFVSTSKLPILSLSPLTNSHPARMTNELA